MRALILLTSAAANRRRRQRQLRLLGVLAMALAGVTCRDQNPLAPGLPTRASLAVAPTFERPDARRVAGTVGGFFKSLKTVHGTLTPVGGGAPYKASAEFNGGTAQLVFDVAFAGPSQRYSLLLTASDTAGDTLFRSIGEVVAEPGANMPVAPLLEYVAPDTAVRFLNVAASDTMLVIGDSLTLSVTGRSATNQAIFPVRAVWTLRDTSGASVSARSGSMARLFGGRSDDNVWVVGQTFNGSIDSVLVRVRVAVASLALSADTLRLTVGDVSSLSAQVFDANSNLLEREVSWLVTDSRVASVSSGTSTFPAATSSRMPTSNYARVQALDTGTTKIVAKSGGKTDSVVVIVAPVPVASVVVTPDSIALLPGKQARFGATPLDASGAPLAARVVSWSVDDSRVATIDGEGTVTAVAGGTATVRAKVEGVIGSATVRVDTQPTAIVRTTVTPGAVELRALGATTQLTARSYAADSSLVGASYSWSVAGTSVVSVDSLGRVTARAPGSVYVRAVEPGGTSDSALVTVSQVATSVAVSPSALTVDAVGAAATFRAVALDSLGSPIALRSFYWSVSDPAVGQVELMEGDSVVVRTMGIGYTKIVAWADAASGTAELTVNQGTATATSATLGPATMTLGVGGRGKLTLSLFDENGMLMPYDPRQVMWIEEGSGSVVSIDSTGEVLAESFGSVLVHAEVSGIVTGSVTIVVSDNAAPVITFSSDTLSVSDTAVVTAYLSTPSQSAVFVALAESNQLLKISTETLVFDKTTRQQFVITRSLDGTTTLTATDAGKLYGPAAMEIYVGLVPEKVPDQSPAPPPSSN